MPATQKIIYKGNGTSKKITSKKDFDPQPHFVQMSGGTELEGIRKDVFLDRYSLKDIDGKPMEMFPEQMWKRVAWGIAQQEKTSKLKKEWEDKFYQALRDFKFVPAGRILSGSGTGYQVTFYNCYVIPSPKDSREGIMENLGLTVEIQARGGGVGVNLSSLRPRGARVRKVNGTSSGPVNWASLYSTANHDVIQQGGSRRGALMLMLNDWHPDIEEFITVKQDLSKIPGANLSVCVSDAFMEAVNNDSDWELVYPDFPNEPDYDEVWDGDMEKWINLGRKVIVYRTVKARHLWDLIAQAAWRSAEPGVVFIDRYNKLSNSWYFEKIIATNPCGEQGLGEWGVCNLGHINLSPFVKNGELDYEDLKKHVRIATRFLDNVIEANYYFSDENRKVQQDGIRRTGLGTLGLADALIKMNIRYGSEESLTVIEEIYKTIRDTAYDTAADLAKEKGSFPKFDRVKYLKGLFVQQLPKEIKEKIRNQGIRNGILLTQAPTGTISLLAGVSSGIEPVYEFSYKRTDRTGEHIVHHPLFAQWLKEHESENVPDYFVSANQLTPEEHVRVQAMVQKYVDASISKTVNAPQDHTVEDVKKLYSLAYDLGCKGVTYFRDGSRKGVLEKINEGKKQADGKELVTVASVKAKTWERPVSISGETYKLKTPVGTAFITINEDEDGNPVEMFINIGKAGSDIAAMAEAMGRVISKSLQFDGSLNSKEQAVVIVDQLKGIGGRTSVGFGQSRIRSLPDAISIALATHCGVKTNGNGNGNHVETANMEADSSSAKAATVAIKAGISGAPPKGGVVPDPALALSELNSATKKEADICPSCGKATLVYEEGCAKCYSCGHAEC